MPFPSLFAKRTEKEDDEFCDGCREFNVDDFACCANSSDPNVKPPPFRIGKFYDIPKNKRCPLCRLISSVLAAHLKAHFRVRSPPEEFNSASVWLEVVSMPTLRLVLKWGDHEDLGISLPDTFKIVPVTRPTDKRVVDAMLAKSWLSSCESEHTTCNTIAQNISVQNSAGYVFIDVNQCTRSRPQQLPRFVALSYVVGGVTHKVGNDYTKAFGLRNLPKTLRDSIIFTRLIGEKYLWIDSLCISQDEAEKKEQITHMDQIYSRAVCVLIAAWGQNGKAGIPASHDQSPRTVPAQLPISEFLKPGEPTGYMISALNLDDAYLAAMDLVKKHKWITRTWTVQERLLARRVVVFNGREVFFYCHEGRGFESRTNLEAWTTADFEFCLDREKINSADKDQDMWITYAKIVRAVADRQISYENDRLNAVSGLIQYLTTQTGTKFKMGLPLSHIAYALMWDCQKIHSTDEYPSWTWLGKVPELYTFETNKLYNKRVVDVDIEVLGPDDKLLRLEALAVQTPANKVWRCSAFELSSGATSWDSMGPEPWANIHPDGRTWSPKRKTIRLGTLHCLLLIGSVIKRTNDFSGNPKDHYFLNLLAVQETGNGQFKRFGLVQMPSKEFDDLNPQKRQFVLK